MCIIFITFHFCWVFIIALSNLILNEMQYVRNMKYQAWIFNKCLHLCSTYIISEKWFSLHFYLPLMLNLIHFHTLWNSLKTFQTNENFCKQFFIVQWFILCHLLISYLNFLTSVTWAVHLVLISSIFEKCDSAHLKYNKSTNKNIQSVREFMESKVHVKKEF